MCVFFDFEHLFVPRVHPKEARLADALNMGAILDKLNRCTSTLTEMNIIRLSFFI